MTVIIHKCSAVFAESLQVIIRVLHFAQMPMNVYIQINLHCMDKMKNTIRIVHIMPRLMIESMLRNLHL